MVRAAAVLLLGLAGTSALRDVPLGECYDCEVTCFEDCQLKFDREVITPDGAAFAQNSFLQRAPAKNHTPSANRSHIFGWRKKQPQNVAKQEAEKLLIEQGNTYAICLKENKCQGHPVSQSSWVASGRNASMVRQSKPCTGIALLNTGDAKKKERGACQVSDPSCAMKCASKAAATKPSFMQDFPLHPVKIGVFSRGEINMDFCLKSCLAATCGCDRAPGFDPISMEKHVKLNAAAGEPVKDTPPAWQYRKATLKECAKGIFGKKVTSDMYINYGTGWNEVCSDEFLTITAGAGVDIAPMKKKCASTAQDDVPYGCIWNNEKEECVFGAQVIGKCYMRYHDDKTL